MQENGKKKRFGDTGRGTSYKEGRARFAGFTKRTDGLKMDGFLDVKRACSEWLDKNEDRGKGWRKFNYGKNGGDASSGKS